MFKQLRNPTGSSTRLMMGLAFLALAGVFLFVQLPGTVALILAAVSALLGLACLGSWWRLRQEERYDLQRLFDPPPPEPESEEPFLDAVPEGEASAPYCGWCDEAYPPGTYLCTRCGRSLG
jgi:hypothetical protein